MDRNRIKIDKALVDRKTDRYGVDSQSEVNLVYFIDDHQLAPYLNLIFDT